jgi:hypothetical protein
MSMLYLGIGMLVVGALVVIGGIVTRGKAKRILATPLRKTGEAANGAGMASFEGQVKAWQPLTAPCSNQPCVYYNLKIEKKVKEKRGNQTTTSWKTVSDQHQGSAFQLDDGSGPVLIQGQEALDADLVQTYSGPPPGGQGLGALASMVANVMSSRDEEILEYRATEKIIPVDARLFALGQLDGGQLGKPANRKLLVSTRGRDALVGSTKRLATILFAFGGLVAAGGIPIMILKPGEARPCGVLEDVVGECAVTSTVVEKDMSQSDGTKKMTKMQEHILDWTVTRSTKFELSARQDPKAKGKSNPVVQVENAIGLPMNIGLNLGLGIGNSAKATKTKTMKLLPGEYKIYVWGDEKGPDKFLITIADIGDGKVTAKN